MKSIEISTRELRNSQPGMNNTIAMQASEVNKAHNNLTNEAKYDSREDLGGVAMIHDKARETLLNIEGRKTTAFVSLEKLTSQKQALDGLNSIMVNFEKTHIQTAAAAGTDVEQANEALKNIQTLLRQTDQYGNYIWGGNNPRVDPLSIYDGDKRVSSDLCKTSNIVRGIPINNYSDASPNEDVRVTISSQHEIKLGFLSPGMDPLIKAIGYLNMIKEGTASKEEIGKAQQSQLKARGESAILIDLEIKKVEKSHDVNKIDMEGVQNILKNFKGDIVHKAGKARDLMCALLGSIAASRGVQKMKEAVEGMLKQP